MDVIQEYEAAAAGRFRNDWQTLANRRYVAGAPSVDGRGARFFEGIGGREVVGPLFWVASTRPCGRARIVFFGPESPSLTPPAPSPDPNQTLDGPRAQGGVCALV